MKFIPICAGLLFALNFAIAQPSPPNGTITQKTRTFRIDEHTVVKDSTGKIIPFAAWSKLTATKEYVIRPESMEAENPAFILVKKAQVEQEKVQYDKAVAAAKESRLRYTPPTEASVVKDSSGMVYPYLAWHQLLMTNNYSLRMVNSGPDAGSYILNKRSQEEKNTMMARIHKPEESKQFISGTAFSPFKEKDMNGEKLDLKKMTGKVIVLNFWFIGCPPCRAEIPELTEMANNYKGNPDVVFIAVALDESYDLKDFLKDHPLSYHVIDNGRYIADRYRVHLYPTNVVIDRDSKVAYSSEGGHMNNIYWMEKTIDAALASAQKTTAAQ